MKKILLFGGILVAIFVAIAVITTMQQSSQLENNPYGTDDLEGATIDLLDDENYQNQIVPEDLEEQIASGEPTTVYFFSPTCVYCQQVTPMLSPLAEDMDVDMVKFNLLEFEEGFAQYAIEATPTLVYYENGEEVQRIVGAAQQADYESFFNQYVLKQ